MLLQKLNQILMNEETGLLSTDPPESNQQEAYEEEENNELPEQRAAVSVHRLDGRRGGRFFGYRLAIHGEDLTLGETFDKVPRGS